MSRQSLFLCPASPYTAEQQAATSQKSQLRNSYSEKKMRESMLGGRTHRKTKIEEGRLTRSIPELTERSKPNRQSR